MVVLDKFSENGIVVNGISIYCLKDIGLTPAQNLLELGRHIIFIYDLTDCV
jgi:hypothetical protein